MVGEEYGWRQSNSGRIRFKCKRNVSTLTLMLFPKGDLVLPKQPQGNDFTGWFAVAFQWSGRILEFAQDSGDSLPLFAKDTIVGIFNVLEQFI